MRDDVKQSLEAWDAGQPVWSITMSGLGPSHEQSIQILVMELLRADQDIPEGKPLEDGLVYTDLGQWGNDVVARINDVLGGLTDLQVGAAKNLALGVMRKGWEAILSETPGEDRQIQISSHFPDAAKARP